MTRPSRRTARFVLPLLAGCALASAATAHPAPSGPGTSQQAVVLYRQGPVSVGGVRLVAALPALHAAVVRGDAGALARLAAQPGVRGLAPDDVVVLTGGDDQPGSRGVPASAGLSRAGASAGKGVRVAVVDTGVSDTPYLNRASGRLVDAVDTSPVLSGEDVRTTGRFDDGYGHGTFMASLIAGGRDHGAAAVGVAPGASVLVVRVADARGVTSLSAVLAGLDWVAAHPERVDVANLSFSHVRPGTAYGADPLTDAVEQVRDEGVTVVVSAGNTPGQVGDPGFDPRVLTVGASDVRTGQVTSFSGSASAAGVAKPDLVASGASVLGALPPDSVIAREHPDAREPGGLWRGSGTSQATAVTSGVVARLLDRHPGATPAQLKATLRAAAADLPGDRDGTGELRVPRRLLAGSDGAGLDGQGDLTGEGGFDANSWSANSWSANSWSANSWSANSWSANSWSANSWSGVWSAQR